MIKYIIILLFLVGCDKTITSHKMESEITSNPEIIETDGLLIRGSSVYMGNLPIFEPISSGYLWNDNGVLKISN